MRPLIVAEMSANHLGSYDRAEEIIKAAKESGADAIKLQTYTPDSMTANDWYRLTSGPWKGHILRNLYRKAQTPWHWHPKLFGYARRLKLIPFSSPFDRAAVDFLEGLDCPIYKIASFELLDLELIEYAAGTGKPLIMSTGMATLGEIREAVDAARSGGCHDLTLLKCTSAYPADCSEANLLTMTALQDVVEDFPIRVGVSDHTRGLAVSVAATAMGARVIEKHLTLRRMDGGPDAGHSLEPFEFRLLVTECRQTAKALGEVRFGPTESEKPQLLLRRSLYFTQDLPAGTVIEPQHLRTARPALGIAPKYAKQAVGCTLKTDVSQGQPVRMEVFHAIHTAVQ